MVVWFNNNFHCFHRSHLLSITSVVAVSEEAAKEAFSNQKHTCIVLVTVTISIAVVILVMPTTNHKFLCWTAILWLWLCSDCVVPFFHGSNTGIIHWRWTTRCVGGVHAFTSLAIGTMSRNSFHERHINPSLLATVNGQGDVATSPNTESIDPNGRSIKRSSSSSSPPLSSVESNNPQYQETRTQLRSITVSPLQVSTGTLHYYHPDSDTVDPQVEYQTSVYLNRPVSLATALRRMRDALSHLSLSDPTTVLRLEQRLYSGTTDPLAWLSAQVEPTRLASTRSIATAPLFYFGDGPTTEVAVLGSVQTVFNTDHVWASLNSSDLNDDGRVKLPTNARWYGGEPFDREGPRRGPWKAWWNEKKEATGGTAWWILPAVEIRKEETQPGRCTTTLAIHVTAESLARLILLLDEIDYKQLEQRAPTTLPPILSRDGYLPDSLGDVHDGQDLYEQAVQTALSDLAAEKLQKVVLARPQRLHFGVPLSASSLLRRWKYGGHEGGTLFWMRPESKPNEFANQPAPNFVGCTPERLFRVSNQQVSTEALAGTRPRGGTAADDAQLCQELFDSPKDMAENQLTGDFIVDTLKFMEDCGWVRLPDNNNLTDYGVSSVFVRRLRHLQHICHSYTADIVDEDAVQNVTQYLLNKMHPTPAVCGLPASKARRFIRRHESVGFDRGFYSGPVGYLGRDRSDMVVAIRSGVIEQSLNKINVADSGISSTLTLYAGAGIVPGSTVKGEWAETNYKLAVVGSLFPQSPFSLQGSHTPNSAWAAAFVEELIRTGITQFYICPGSRSTPLVVAVSRALRSHMGVVHADSVHDERAAAFRALGYARGDGKPAAIITSSGTAVANLYPAVVEASMDGVPMLLLTADRPYESRSTGANQAIDQVGIFSSSYVRWSRDIPPPSDEVPISLVLSDVDHAVDVSKRLRGPVHLNIQFRENLAPDSGRIRNDDRVDAITKFSAYHFTSSPKFRRWSTAGGSFTQVMPQSALLPNHDMVQQIAQIIESSKRGIIVVGNVRPSVAGTDNDAVLSILDSISDFAEYVGFPIFAGVQSTALRFRSSAVVLFAEHLLRSPIVKENLKPDLIIQIGAPLVSTELPGLIRKAMATDEEVNHVFLHPHSSNERFDPDFTVTHRISAEILPWMDALRKTIQRPPSSELAPMITLGRRLQSEMKDIIHSSVSTVTMDSDVPPLSEPEIIIGLAETIHENKRHAIFLSNSMPIRDAEAFLYPLSKTDGDVEIDLCVVGTSRGASGIDGIISTAKGLAEYCQCPTTLLLGDVSALHDISSLHALANDAQNQEGNPGKGFFPLTTIVVNNDGGGIFSFLPIASHGDQVNFNEFFGTPTNSFDFQKGSEAFGVPCEVASDFVSFQNLLKEERKSRQHSLLESRVAERTINVKIHREISSRTNILLENTLRPPRLPILNGAKIFKKHCVHKTQGVDDSEKTKRTLVLLHGWMGDGSEWDNVLNFFSEDFLDKWSVVTVDLPGHGAPKLLSGSGLPEIRRALKIDDDSSASLEYTVEYLARSVLSLLKESNDIGAVDAVSGYSLGGRVALAMRDICQSGEFTGVLGNRTKLILIGAAPRVPRSLDTALSEDEVLRIQKDDSLYKEILRTSRMTLVRDVPLADSHLVWSNFVDSWYGIPMWGDLKRGSKFDALRRRRSRALHVHGSSIAYVLRGCSPPGDYPSTRVGGCGNETLYVSGGKDLKYSAIGKQLALEYGVWTKVVPESGHALLVESPIDVAEAITSFLLSMNLTTSTRYEPHISNDEFSEESIQEDFVVEASTESFVGFQSVPFSVDLVDQSSATRGQAGIGWGDKVIACNRLNSRSGFLIEARTSDGRGIAVGEASPLDGVHPETSSTVSLTLQSIKEAFITGNLSFQDLDHKSALKLDGSLSEYLKSVCGHLLPHQTRSVYSALEMVVLGLASQASGVPLLQAMARSRDTPLSNLQNSIRLNGLALRKMSEEPSKQTPLSERTAFSSIKVKVGHQDANKDRQAILDAFARADLQRSRGGTAKVRLDANRAWNESEALQTIASLEGIDARSFDRIEFIEEPLQQKTIGDFLSHMEELERFYRRSGLRYALDESLADLAQECNYDFQKMRSILRDAFPSSRGCAVFVLKPTLLGLELSMQLATLARTELGIGAVFTSCFESGVALSYIALVAALSDSVIADAPIYAHGLGTFEMIGADTLSPAFSSHVDEFGRLNVASLSRSLFGLSLSELQQETRSGGPSDLAQLQSVPSIPVGMESSIEASSSSTQPVDSEISFAVSLDLPFSAQVAHARFTDLPQQPRWSPWLSSVAYHQGTQETEWKLSIRGIPLTWRAQSNVTYEPWPAISWGSVSGLSNSGTVEFIPTQDTACEMRVRLVARPPRMLRPLFRGASIFLEDFVREKVLKWSLEMFRDVVKADLALERGDVELGDALFGAVAGKAVAIEAALNSASPTVSSPSDDSVDE